ncbi:MAG: ABC transporter permease [Simkaniaceae bacterium]|nr:ABC transporter permease [Simkaniaceae bacterium]
MRISSKIALAFLIFLLISCIIIPFISPYTYYHTNLPMKNLLPCFSHPFGTDELGRDIFTRIFFGVRISLFIGVTAAVLDMVVGVIYGAIAGFFGGKIDELMMRFVDILNALPHLLIVILLMVLLGQGIGTIIIALTCTGWITMARIIRSQTLQLRELDYIIAAKLYGASPLRILLSHLIPNTMGSILTTMTLTIPIAIYSEAFLSFLGLGVQMPLASLGTMAHDGLPAMRYYPWRLFFPAGFITCIMLSFNLLGDGLQDYFNPRVSRC